jgi:hypothetical protein
VIAHGTSDFTPRAFEGMINILRSAGTSSQPRSRAEITRFFDGWDLMEPGVTPTYRWRPDESEGPSDITDAEAGVYAAVARKP